MPSGLRINVVPIAQAHIREAVAWWRDNRPAAPNAVTDELRRAFRLLQTRPGIGTAARSPRLTGVRRVHLDRIRYHLYYRADAQRGEIDVLALWHSSRGVSPPLR
jgi:plasmid stabilization system protein ParE